MSSTEIPKALRHSINVSVFRGDDVETFAVLLRDEAAGSMAKGDYTITAQLRVTKDAASIAETWTLTVTDNGDDDEIDPDTLKVTFDMTDTKTAALGVGSWYWDLQVYGPDEKTWTPVDGTLRIEQDVTVVA